MDFLINEILEEIFSNLDQKSLVNASLVCKRWANIIQNSSYLMRKFECMISQYNNNLEMESVFKVGKYRNLTITLNGTAFNFKTDVIANLIRQNECIRNVNLRNFNPMNSILVISMFTNITKLSISDYQCDDDVISIIDIPNLKELELINSISFVEIIGRQAIRILKIFGEKENRYQEDLNSRFNNILRKSKDLKDLTISNLQLSNSNLDNDYFEFNLESLTIEKFSFDEENLIDFLIKQKSSLKKLAIFNILPKSNISKIIFSHLNLNDLEVDVSIIPRTFNPHFVNKTIKTLTIRSANNHLYSSTGGFHRLAPPNSIEPHVAIIRITSICQVVEEFKVLETTFDSMLQYLHCSLQNLKVLKIQSLPKFVSPTINFDMLEVIEIDKISSELDIQNCQFLVFYSPNLQTFKINFMSKELFTSKFFNLIITKSKNLRNIHIGAKCRLSLDMMNTVRQIKGLGHPLQKISFSSCIVDDNFGHIFNDIFMDELKLNFHQNSNKFFSLMINETRLGRIMRERNEKNDDHEKQERLKAYRDYNMAKYKRI